MRANLLSRSHALIEYVKREKAEGVNIKLECHLSRIDEETKQALQLECELLQ